MSDTQLSRPLRLSYSAGALGTGVFATVPGLLLLYYLTDIIGVAAGTASVILLVPKLWDAVLNPLVGAYCDRSQSRFGNRRPLILVGAISVPLGFMLLFAAPDMSPNATAVWVGVAFTIAMTGYAFFQVPWVAMPADMTDDYHEQTRLMSTRMVFLTVGILLGGAVAPLISGGKEGAKGGYALMGLVLGLVLLAALLICWRGTRSARQAPPLDGPRPTLRDQLAVVRANPMFVTLFGAYFLQSIAVGGMLAAAPYVATYLLDDSDLAAVIFVCFVVPTAVVMPLWRRFSLKAGKARGYVIASIIYSCAAGALLVSKVAPNAVVFLLVAVLGVGYAGMQLFAYSMLPDVFALTGTSKAGILTGVWQGGETVGLALGPAFYGLILAACGFISSDADVKVAQPDGAINGLLVGFSLMPALFFFVSIPLLRTFASKDAAFAAAAAPEVAA